MRLLICILFFSFFFKSHYALSKCPKKISSPKTVPSSIEKFLSNSLYALHIKLTDEGFSSDASLKSRSILFDTIFNTSYWSSKVKNKDDFSILWNWIRFQYWSLIQRQGLIREDQGFKIVKNKTLAKSYEKILRLPIYPSVRKLQPYKCNNKESITYPCNGTIFLAQVYFSPSLACEPDIDLKAFTFDFLISKTQFIKQVIGLF